MMPPARRRRRFHSTPHSTFHSIAIAIPIDPHLRDEEGELHAREPRARPEEHVLVEQAREHERGEAAHRPPPRAERADERRVHGAAEQAVHDRVPAARPIEGSVAQCKRMGRLDHYAE